MSVQEIIQTALQHHQAGQLADAEAIYRQVLAEQPNHPDALHLLGVICYQAGRHEEAARLITQAIAGNPSTAEYHRNLGLALVSLKRWDEAAASYTRALNLRPNYPKALHNLGSVLHEQGKAQQAVAACQRAVQLQPNYPEAWNTLGAMLLAKGDLMAAEHAYRQAIAQQPNYPQAYFNLGIVLQQKQNYDQAMTAYMQAVEQNPNYTEALTNLGVIHKICGRLDEAMHWYQQAVDVQPNNTTAHSNLIYLLEFHDRFSPAQIAEKQRDYEQQHAAPLYAGVREHDNDRSPDRRIRIGYLSPDLRHHVVGSNLLPLLREHDHQNFEVFCYASVETPDSMSQRLQAFADTWRDVAKLDDAAAAELIRSDKIDILIDLTLHMADNRLGVMARKPAPVQVSYLGYCGSTGLRTVDYRISDPYMDPPELPTEHYSEKTIRLPHCYWCYQRPDPAPKIAPPPVVRMGHVTFGCLNNFSKVSPAALDLWAKVLAAVPNSRLLLHCLPGSHHQGILARFGDAANRVEFVGKQPFWQYLLTYHRIDVALDPFPYAGGITTCDGLWMGVPIVTLRGQTAVGRGGCSILANIGLSEWIANSPEEYVRLAADLAGDVKRLVDLRDNLRPRMLTSRLMEPKPFARDVEAAYRLMWRNWCEGSKS